MRIRRNNGPSDFYLASNGWWFPDGWENPKDFPVELDKRVKPVVDLDRAIFFIYYFGTLVHSMANKQYNPEEIEVTYRQAIQILKKKYKIHYRYQHQKHKHVLFCVTEK